MKKAITYREITVAIGILVAMVIAFTLWIKKPAEPVTHSSSSQMTVPIAVKSALKTTFSYFAELR